MALGDGNGRRGRSFAPRLQEYLRLKGFDESIKFSIDAGSNQRGNLAVLKRGRSPQTIVLTGHFDTVPYEDYGALADLALESGDTAKSMITGFGRAARKLGAFADFESGDFSGAQTSRHESRIGRRAGGDGGLSGDASILFLAVR